MDFYLLSVIVCIIVFCFVLKYHWMKTVMCHSSARMDGKTVIVTGANTGIGKETAKELARRGARVILACRDGTKADRAVQEIREQTDNQQVVYRHLDLSSLQSVREFSQQILKDEKQLHVLINNAGMGGIPFTKTSDGFEMTFAVNHLGHFLLTNLLLDLLKSSTPSRIVNVSALAHAIAKLDFDDLMMEKHYSPVMAYCKSKLANILFTRELSKRLGGTGVTAYALHPGVIQTELLRNFSWMKYRVTRFLFTNIAKHLLKSPREGSQTTIYCALAEELETVSGLYYSDCAPATPTTAAFNDEDAKKLWDISEQLVGLN